MKILKFMLNVLLGIFVLYGIAGFFILPDIVKEQVLKNAQVVLKRTVTLEDVYVNPYTFQVNLERLVIHGKKGEEAFAGVRELGINVDPLQLVKGEINIKFIEVISPFLRIHKKDDCTFNFSDLLTSEIKTESNETKSDMQLPEIVLEKLSIRRGKVHYLDESGSDPLRGSLTPINFTLYDFSTMQDHDNQLSLHVEIDDGAAVDYRGKINSIDPLRLEGTLNLKSGRLYTQWQYFRDSLGFIVADGSLNASMSYTADLSTEPIQVNINKYQLEIERLKLQDKENKEDVLKLPHLALEGSADLSSNQVNVDNLSIDNFFIKVRRDKSGEINWLSYLPASDTTSKSEPTEENNSSSLNWKVDSFKLSNSNIDFEDNFNVKNALTQLDKINLEVKDLRSQEQSWADSELSLRINKSGELLLSSKIRHTPLKTTSTFSLKNLDLTSFQAYVNTKANIDVKSGKFNLDFKANVEEEKTKVIADTRISNLNLIERQEGKSFFAFSELSIKDIDFSLHPDQMKIAKVDIYKPYARVKIDENKKSNLNDLMLNGTSASKDTTNAGQAKKKVEKPFSVLISKVNFKEGKGEFSDFSLPLPFMTNIHDLNGKMIALGNISEVKSTVDLDGVVDEYGLAKIKGQVLSSNPKKFTDMALKFQNLDMTNLSPYTGKFIGYKLEKGKMNVELDYKINDSQMIGGNRVVLKQMTLGESVESEDAISAPVGLAIALLKDSDGVIDLDVPVTGNVDEPEFKVGHVVWTAFKNLIIGVATAPFRFLGDMLGISADELENVNFEEGKVTLLPPEREKMDKLSTALAEKKMLILKLVGTYDGKRDLLAIQTDMLYQEALGKLEDNTTDISHMDRDDLDDLFKGMYVEHFGKEKLNGLENKIDEKDLDTKAQKELFRQEIKDSLIQGQKITQKDLAQLAIQRAKNIRSYLHTKGIALDRIELLESVEIEVSAEESEYIPIKLELGAK